jgi:hypothetical protein
MYNSDHEPSQMIWSHLKFLAKFIQPKGPGGSAARLVRMWPRICSAQCWKVVCARWTMLSTLHIPTHRFQTKGVSAETWKHQTPVTWCGSKQHTWQPLEQTRLEGCSASLMSSLQDLETALQAPPVPRVNRDEGFQKTPLLQWYKQQREVLFVVGECYNPNSWNVQT